MKFSIFSKGLQLALLSLAIISGPAFSADSIIAPKAKDSLLLDIQKLPSGRLVTVGERGHILTSDDQGQTWQQKQTPTRNDLTSVDFYDDQWGVAVGYQQVVLITKDGGETWAQTYIAEDSIEFPALFDVEFIELNKIIAVGAFGLYLESSDGGANWKERQVDSLADFYGGFSHFYGLVHQAGSKNLYLAGEKYVANETADGEEVSSGLLAVSRNNGLTWSKINSPYDGSFFGVTVAPNKAVYAYGLKGNLFRSNNYGISWQKINVATNSGLHAIEFINDEWFSVGTSGTLLGSSLPVQQRGDLKGRAAIVATDEDTLVIVGEGGAEIVKLSEAEKATN